jgi:hypothetical protein
MGHLKVLGALRIKWDADEPRVKRDADAPKIFDYFVFVISLPSALPLFTEEARADALELPEPVRVVSKVKAVPELTRRVATIVPAGVSFRSQEAQTCPVLVTKMKIGCIVFS